MDNPKQQIVDRLKQANNILVTVSANPSVDQLAACIGLTLLLNKFGKHGTAVFSGAVPSTIEFLEPEKTIEKNTDSLRDFIIALDKSKADKLRYKVEDKVVRIFITPYRTSITEKDLEFSQGDFNVEMIIALGVREQQELDQAITAHGRILHDATVVSVNNGPGGNLGTIHWQDAAASSLSEMVASLGDELDKKLLDNQIATALLTGIVAETNRFSNSKTTSITMSLSAALMAAGANQQLVASKLQEGAKPSNNSGAQASAASSTDKSVESPKPENGTLEIDHSRPDATSLPPPAPEDDEAIDSEHQIRVDQEGRLSKLQDVDTQKDQPKPLSIPEPVPSVPLAQGPNSRLVVQPPSLSGTLTANSQPEGLDPSTDPLSLSANKQPLLRRDASAGIAPMPTPDAAAVQSSGLPTSATDSGTSQQSQPTAPTPDSNNAGNQTASNPPQEGGADIDKARDAVQAAINAAPTQDALPPIQALGSQPLFDAQATPNVNPLSGSGAVLPPATPSSNFANESLPPPISPMPPQPTSSPAETPPKPIEEQLDTLNMPPPPTIFPPNLAPPTPNTPPQTDAGTDQSAPPPVPPPMMPFPPQANK